MCFPHNNTYGNILLVYLIWGASGFWGRGKGGLMGKYSPTKARDFEGPGGPETKQKIYEEANPGNDDVRENVRQGGETRRP